MGARLFAAAHDPIRPGPSTKVSITVDGVHVQGLCGQSLAGVMMAAGISSWRDTSIGDRPRGLFCGIGICFDCLVDVNGLRDVRACQRRAADGDAVLRHRDLPIHNGLSSDGEL